MKKFISFITVFTLVLSCVVPSGVNAAMSDDNSLISFISSLDIMKGDPDGNFRLNDNINRSEFTKVCVAASKYKDYIAPNAYISPSSFRWLL